MFDDRGLVPNDLEAPANLIQCDRVFDIGAGVRPVDWYVPEHHICVEPCSQYANRLEAAGYEVRRFDALAALQAESVATRHKDKTDAVYMLDVIEHMPREVGEQCIEAAKRYAKQIVIFTPNGFKAQTGDAWGLGGDRWQEHRSGWVPEDFPGWSITHRGDGFMAVWTA